MDFAEFDLHVHTNWSYDGFSCVEDYFKLARERKVRAFAIADHELMDAYEEVVEVAAKYPDVHYVAGAEFIVSSPVGSFHMLCLGLPLKPEAELQEVFNRMRVWQVEYGNAISNNLQRMGFHFDFQDRMKLLQSYRPQRIIDKQGCTYVRNGTLREEMIRRHIAETPEQWSEIRAQFTDMPKNLSSDYILPIVKRAGGTVIIAHPYGAFRQMDVKRMDELREVLGFDGIECAHPSVPQEVSPFYREYCRKHGLVSTGGSDSHFPTPVPASGAHLTKVDFAYHCGAPQWLDELLERVTLY